MKLSKCLKDLEVYIRTSKNAIQWHWGMGIKRNSDLRFPKKLG